MNTLNRSGLEHAGCLPAVYARESWSSSDLPSDDRNMGETAAGSRNLVDTRRQRENVIIFLPRLDLARENLLTTFRDRLFL